MTPTTTLNVTLTGVTPTQFEALTKLLSGETPSKKKTTPQKTVSDDEDEDFGTKPLKAKNLEEDYESEESDEDSEEDETEDEESSITFKDVRAAVNKYGEKHPDQMRAILLGFNMKSPKELSAKHNERHWEPLYRKVMAKIKAAKKNK